MIINPSGSVALLLTVTAVSALCLGGAPRASWSAEGELRFPAWVSQRLEASYPADGSQALRIANHYGDIRCRKGQSTELELSAVAQSLDSDSGTPNLEVRQLADGGLLVEPGFARAGGEAVHAEAVAKRRIDLVVFVPPGAALTLETDEGLIEVKKLDNDVTATSVRGDIRVSNRGELSAYTERGTIEVSFGDTAWRTPPRLETVTGDLRVFLPAAASARVDIETHGSITTDYSIHIDRQGPGWPSQGLATIGEAGQTLELRSDRGNVSLLREPGT